MTLIRADTWQKMMCIADANKGQRKQKSAKIRIQLVKIEFNSAKKM